MKITDASHLDHGLTPAHVAFVRETFGAVDSFTIESVELPEHLEDLMCGLHGPATGDAPVTEDEIHLAVRGDRPGPSRLVNRAPKPTRLLTVIIGPAEDEDDVILYTAFGGPLAPREPFDEALQSDPEALAASKAFWAQHALSA